MWVNVLFLSHGYTGHHVWLQANLPAEPSCLLNSVGLPITQLECICLAVPISTT